MSEWVRNTGKQPVEDDVLVDVKFCGALCGVWRRSTTVWLGVIQRE